MPEQVDTVYEVPTWDALDATGKGAYLITNATEGGQLGFIINCPRCGLAASSSSGHLVETRAPLTVSPSFVCPHQGCGAHYFIRGGSVQWVSS